MLPQQQNRTDQNSGSLKAWEWTSVEAMVWAHSSLFSAGTKKRTTEPEGRRDLDIILDFLSMHTKAKIIQLVQITIWIMEQNIATSFMI